MTTPPLMTLRAKWVVPIATGPIAALPIENGYVSIVGERIVAVGQWGRHDEPATDLGDVALLPGFVNAHTHLEFSDLAAPLGQPGMSLPEWIKHIIPHRRRATADPTAAVARGLRESLAVGVTTIGEIAQPLFSPRPFADAGIDATIFLECLSLAAERAEPLTDAARQHVLDHPNDGGTDDETCGRRIPSPTGLARGISPHAPYSVHPELLTRLVALAIETNAPIAMHVAESREELELLATQRGAFRDLLEAAGFWRDDAFTESRRPLHVLRQLSSARRSLIIHGNYLDDAERTFLAEHADRMTLVYCPRTHAFFDHDPYPLAAMLQQGVALAVGTDSRASSPDLSVLGELRHIAAHHATISLDAILRLGTQSAADALGRDDVGRIAPGAVANLVAINLPAATSNPYDAILHGDGRITAVVHRGLLNRPT